MIAARLVRTTVARSRLPRVPCAGNVHSSVVEYLVRSGVGGVLVAACPPRDCWSREGPKWAAARLSGERPAELKERVDQDRVRIAYAAEAEGRVLAESIRDYAGFVTQLAEAEAEKDIEIDLECEVPVVGVADGADA